MKQKFFVPYKTAQALKTAGYNEESKDWYDGKGVLWSNEYHEPSNSDLAETHYSAPTYFEVIDWLKSKNSSIHISIYDDPNPNTSEHKYSCVLYYGYLKSENETTFKYRKVFNGDTAENVLNDAILELVEYFKK